MMMGSGSSGSGRRAAASNLREDHTAVILKKLAMLMPCFYLLYYAVRGEAWRGGVERGGGGGITGEGPSSAGRDKLAVLMPCFYLLY